MSILSHLAEPDQAVTLPETVRLLYSTRIDEGGELEKVLFLPRLRRIFDAWNSRGEGVKPAKGEYLADLHLTSDPAATVEGLTQMPLGPGLRIQTGRISRNELKEVIGPTVERRETVCYVCGPAVMTDEMVDFLEKEEGMVGRVLCEKWW